MHALPKVHPISTHTQKQEAMPGSRGEEHPLAELVQARLALAGVVEQRLADHAAERPELEGVGVVAEGALGGHQPRVFGAAFLVVALAGHRARAAAVLVGLLVGLHGAHAAGGGLRERAEGAHADSLLRFFLCWLSVHREGRHFR
jgi:hypothetical protein